MAAYAALVSLTRTIDQLLHNDQQQYYTIPHIKNSKDKKILKSLHGKLSFLLDFLEDHPQNSTKTVDDSLEARIRDAAYHAEDLIESNLVPSEYDGSRRGLNGTFWQWISPLRNGVLHGGLFDNISKELEITMGEIDSIVEEAMKTTSEDHVPVPIRDPSRRAEATVGNRMIGFDEDLLKIKDWICGESSKLQVISIVGMGGAGKTTLANSIFDDSLVAYHFDKRAWLIISQQYFLRDILLTLLHSLIEITENLSKKDDEELKEYVYKSLKGRRYLIVMDDMWGTNAWDDFRGILPDDYNGSRVLLTTRILDVAIYVDSSSCSRMHRMQFLDEDQSWSLLRDKVFAQENCSHELEMIGKKIAGKCGGLPLALVLVAGLLSKTTRTPHDWESFSESVTSNLAIDDEHFTKIMSLSYYHLPHHLRPCFLYLGGFPEDYEIPVFKLLQLWIAEGFVRPDIKSLEQVADEYLEDLVRRNLVLITKKSSTGKFRFCMIHDLLRDFCIQKARDENFFHHVSAIKYLLQEDVESKRRLFLFHDQDNTKCKVIGKAASSLHVRSVIFSLYSKYTTELSSLTAASKLLKVYDGHYRTAQPFSFPVELTKLFQLRFLSITLRGNSNGHHLPASISKLRNLQTIILDIDKNFSVYNIVGDPQAHIYLPDEIWNMTQLRHLILHNTCFLPHPVSDTKASVLQNLQTLSRIVGFHFDEKSIAMIPNLKKLGVLYSRWYSSLEWTAFGFHNLVHLDKLESLDLAIHSPGLYHLYLNFDFPPKLRKLSLRGSMFPWEKMTRFARSLPNLEVLKLGEFAFRGEEWVAIEGGFPRLKFLMMDQIRLKRWRTESCYFPSLERLVIRNCWELEEIPFEIGDIPTLQLIEIGPPGRNSAANSAMQIREEQHNMGNDYLQVRVVR